MLRRTDVVDGALKLLDAEGLEGVTTRKLGASLNVQGPALYRHFPTKEALFEAMADRILAGVGAPLPAGPWDRRLEQFAGRLRDALLAHRDGARLVVGTYVTEPNTRLAGEAVLEIMRDAGLSTEQAGWSAFALGHWVLGHTIEEQIQAELGAAGAWQEKLDALTDGERTDFETAALTASFGADPAQRFAYGLRVFIDGLRAQVSRP